MNRLLTCFFFIQLAFGGFAQSNFPSNWCGIYHGTMYIEGISGIVDSVQVDFELLPLGEKNHWSHKMTYHSQRWGDMVHDYEIRWHDSLQNPNLFILDEKNGLLLTEQWINNRFYGHYEVGGNHFMTLLQAEANGLYFEIRCTDPKHGYKTSSEPEPDGSIYHVSTFFQYSTQYVTLHKK